MVRTAERHADMLMAHMPPNDGVFTNRLESRFRSLLLAWGDEAARADATMEALKLELNPATATEMLPEWETAVGLPDPIIGQLATIDERRAAVVARLGWKGSMAKQFYISLAAALGYTTFIFEFVPAMLGRGTTALRCTSRIYADFWRTVWEVWLPTVGGDIIRAYFERLKPANTFIIYQLGSFLLDEFGAPIVDEFGAPILI